MRNYIKDMIHVIGVAAILVTLLAGMTFVAAGNAAVVPPNNNVAVGTMAVVQPGAPATALKASSDFNPAFNRPFFDRPAFNRPFFDRPFFNPFFARPAFNPFFARPAFNPFFSPFFNPFLDVDVEPFGAFEFEEED